MYVMGNRLVGIDLIKTAMRIRYLFSRGAGVMDNAHSIEPFRQIYRFFQIPKEVGL